MTSLHIRPATVSDFPDICRLVESAEELFLIHPSGRFPWTIAQLEKLASERFDLTVLEQSIEVIGFANLYGLQPQQHAFIGNVIITSSQRGHGDGRKLVQHMLKRLFQNYRLPEACISVFADNIPAIKLYRSLGFQPYAEEERHTPMGNRHLIHMRMYENG